jgi:hypothetical protein
MGAWGTGSFDNDTALDFVPEIVNFSIIKKLIDNDSLYYNQARVAAEILLHLDKLGGLWTDQEIIDCLIGCLEGLLEDKKWLHTWNDKGKATKKDVKRLIKGLKRMEGF